jgi:UDP-sugar pyrophosphorylase
MHYYCDYILAYQSKFCDQGVKIPLAIMTSDDTHEQTLELLLKNNYFGMDKNQITIMKQ